LRDALELADAAPKGNLIFVAGHHPLIEGGTRGTAKTRNGEKALAALAEAGVHAILSGHVHDPFDKPVQHGEWTVRMIGAGTLSKRLRSSPPAFNEIRIDAGRFETLARTLSPEPKHPISQTSHAGAR